MPSLLPGFEYDIFISYRQKDNKGDHWVSEFVNALKTELEATFKEDISIYFDENPHDGLHDHDDVDDSLKEKLRSLLFISILSRTYCDPKSFAFEHEFKVFVEQASKDKFGLKVKLAGGNVASRVLPVRIHELHKEDVRQFEEVTGAVMRPIDFIYRESGVNRPLKSTDSRNENLNKTDYGNQINKVGNVIDEIIGSLHTPLKSEAEHAMRDRDAEQKGTITLETQHASIKPASAFRGIQRAARRLMRSSYRIILISIIGALVLFLVYDFFSRHVQASQPIYTFIPTPYAIPTQNGQHRNFAISPDGSSIAYGQGDAGIQVYHFNDFNPIALKGTEAGTNPTFSPDGRFLAFFKEPRIMKYEFATGITTEVISKGERFFHWGIDDKLYFILGLGSLGIWSLPSTGGVPEQVTRVVDSLQEVAHIYPQLLPDKNTLLYTSLGASGGSEDSKVIIQKIGDDKRVVIANKAMHGQFINSGHIVYARNDGNIYLVEFDIKEMRVLSEPRVVLSDVQTSTWSGGSFLSVSGNGTLVYYPRNKRPTVMLTGYSLETGQEIREVGLDTLLAQHAGHGWSTPRFSPNGKSVLVTGRTHGSSDVWLFDRAQGGTERMTFEIGEDEFPAWSPHGDYFAYTSAYTGQARRVYIKKAAGGSDPKLVVNWPRHIHVTSWSPDSLFLAGYDFAPRSRDIWVVKLGNIDSIRVASLDANEIDPVFSPDGKWIAYASDESGVYEIYLVRFPSMSQRMQISAGGGETPKWSSDGESIYFKQDNSRKIVRQYVGQDGQPLRGKSNIVFESSAGILEFQISADGKICYYTTTNTARNDSPLRVVINWFGTLE